MNPRHLNGLTLSALLFWAGAAGASNLPETDDCNRPEWATVLQSAAPVPAQAVWLDRTLIRWPGAAAAGGRYWLVSSRHSTLQAPVGGRITGESWRVALVASDGAPSAIVAQRFAFLPAGVQLRLPQAAAASLPERLREQMLLVQTDGADRVLRSTALQIAGVLDDLYAAAETLPDLGAAPGPDQARFKLWAPTARHVALCLHADASAPAQARLELHRDARTGAWSVSQPGDLSGQTYTYLVDVFVRGVGLVRNRVTDPYSLSLSADSRRSTVLRLDDPAVLPRGWGGKRRSTAIEAPTDLVIYELHVRDFSAGDASVPAAHRGKYLAFTDAGSNGMKHLRALAAAGVTDIHLLPIFDFASVPEQGCLTPEVTGFADSDSQQATVVASAAADCYNWGYDPLHFAAPEGSYASDANDAGLRVLELRRMVQALQRAGLRVGMDLVYNHTSASGQRVHSVLDRIVPGYYHRLNEQGEVHNSTCCANTATEHLMMAKLMIDSAVVWARDYRIDSLRFDLMGHQPREAMKRLQRAVDRAAGRHIHLIGEGWNFGETKDGARFVQASQGSLNGSGIATFSDRGRDAARGGGCCDEAPATLSRQGWLNGQFYDPNAHATAAGVGSAQDLMRSADLVRVGLAGTLRDVTILTHDGSRKTLAEIDYAGQGAGYARQPGEVVNYVENHDNPTLFDINVLKLPVATSREDRARVQVLGLALTAFSQGIAYFHAGIEALRSKSLDRNSFDSGDWFNRLDWTFSDNHFGSGLPPKAENEKLWPAMKPLLADPAIKPGPAEIRFTRDAFFDLLKIRASSSLFRLRSADDVQARLRFENTGPTQEPTLIVARLDGRGLAGAGFDEVVYAINVDKRPHSIELPSLRGQDLSLHPVHRAEGAADKRPRTESSWHAAAARLTVPARTALVYVLPARP